MVVFLGILGMLLGFMVMLSGAITFVRGLPDGVPLRPGRPDPRGSLLYLLNQESLGLGVVLLALDVVLRLTERPFLVPGIVLALMPVALRFVRRSPPSSRPQRRPPADTPEDGHDR